MGDQPQVDRSDAADARRLRRMLGGHGYFLEEEGICGHGPGDEDQARRSIDAAMSDTLFERPNSEQLKDMDVLAQGSGSFVAIKRETVDWPHWSRTPPTEPGYYWVRVMGGVQTVNRVFSLPDELGVPRTYVRTLFGKVADPKHYPIDEPCDIEWFSKPIAEPPA